ncbi:MAG: DUF6468 domain-containing protein [Pseudomonadota bacterium]
MDILMEFLVAALLVATCLYCWALSRKLNALQAGQADMLRTIETFDLAVTRAEQSLAAMNGAGSSMNRQLRDATKRANAAIDELSVMVHAGDNIAARLEGAVNDVRALDARRRRLAS